VSSVRPIEELLSGSIQMRQLLIRCNQLGLVFLLAASFNLCLAQQGAIASLRGPNVGSSATTSGVTESVAPSEQAAILERFVAAETKVREALNQHTFK